MSDQSNLALLRRWATLLDSAFRVPGTSIRFGLDAIVGLVKDRMTAQRLEALHLASGGVRMIDEDGDGVGDKLVEGTWDAELNIGLGLRYAPATFEGSR